MVSLKWMDKCFLFCVSSASSLYPHDVNMNAFPAGAAMISGNFSLTENWRHKKSLEGCPSLGQSAAYSEYCIEEFMSGRMCKNPKRQEHGEH